MRIQAVLGSRERGLGVGDGRSEPASPSSLLETQVQETGPSFHLELWTAGLDVTIPPLKIKGPMSMWEDAASAAIPHLSDGWGGFSMRPSNQHPKMLWPPRQGEGRARLCCQAELSADGPGQQPGGERLIFSYEEAGLAAGRPC